MQQLGLTEREIQRLTLADHEIQRRLRFVGFGPLDAVHVQALSDLIDRHAEEYVASFFEHLETLEEASGLMSDRAAMETARRLKTDHVKAMARGQYGASYVEERMKLGLIYANAGIDPRVFLGAYHHLMRTIGFQIMEHYKDSPVEGFDNFMSLKKVAFFDLSLIVDVIVFERERLIREQQEIIRELSTPVMQIRNGLLLLPLVGSIDSQRAVRLTQDLLSAIRAHRANVVVMDITGVPHVDSVVANHLVQTMMATRLIGARTIVTGVSPEIAQTLVNLGMDVGPLNTVGDLQGGLEEADRILSGKS
jgi:rsbT co-antagonist protein RsbR